MNELNILLAVRYQILRDGIEKILAGESGLHIKSTKKNGDEISELPLEEVDLLILDMDMPELHTGNLITKLCSNYPGLKVLAISKSKNPAFIREIMRSGASGYIFKRQGSNELIEAISQISEGEKYLSDEILRLVIEGDDEPNGDDRYIYSADLTDRELEVLALICQELTNREIADKLHISVRTVDAHRRNVLQKTGAKNTAGLVKYAIRNDIYDL